MALPARFRRPRYLVLIAAIVLLVSVPGGLYLSRRPAPPPELAFSEFLQRVESGSVAKVTFNDRSVIDVAFRDGSVATTIAPPDFVAASP